MALRGFIGAEGYGVQDERILLSGGSREVFRGARKGRRSKPHSIFALLLSLLIYISRLEFIG